MKESKVKRKSKKFFTKALCSVVAFMLTFTLLIGSTVPVMAQAMGVPLIIEAVPPMELTTTYPLSLLDEETLEVFPVGDEQVLETNETVANVANCCVHLANLLAWLALKVRTHLAGHQTL